MTDAELLALPWWKALRTPTMDSHFHPGWASAALAAQALFGGPAVHEKNNSASIADDTTIEAWIAGFEARFGNFRLIQEDKAQHRKKESEWIYAADHGCVKVHFDGDSRVSTTIVTRNQPFVEAFIHFFEETTTKTMPKGRVHVLITTQEGPEFKSMGIGGQLLERANYSDEVLRGYDRIVKDLASATPAGRVAILDGKPGTGKTFLVRGLLDEVKDVTMVIVPANLVVQLAQPGMIPALVQLHQDRGEKPIVFIIEDADECLAPRMGDNMSAVSTILNMGDGILGQLLDIRIVATTNAHRQELDEAIMRPGRLSASVAVGALPMDKAQAIFVRLAPGKDLKENRHGYTLAEIYSLARDEGWEPPKVDRNKVGFNNDDEDEE